MNKKEAEKKNQAIMQVAELANEQLKREAIVAELEDALKFAKKDLSEISEDLLPSAMESADLLSYITGDNIQVKIKEDISLSLKSGQPVQARAWLRKNEHGDLIKNIISVPFGKGQDEQAVKLAKLLKEKEYEFDQVEDVNSGSVKAVLRRELEKGTDVPLDIFGANQYKMSIVKVKN